MKQASDTFSHTVDRGSGMLSLTCLCHFSVTATNHVSNVDMTISDIKQSYNAHFYPPHASRAGIVIHVSWSVSVCVCVCVLVMKVSCAKMAQLSNLLFGTRLT